MIDYWHDIDWIQCICDENSPVGLCLSEMYIRRVLWLNDSNFIEFMNAAKADINISGKNRDQVMDLWVISRRHQYRARPDSIQRVTGEYKAK